MKIHRIVVGPLEENCYIIENPQNSQGVVIDPGAESEKILRFIEEQDIVVKGILLTHGHFDHIGAVRDLKEKTGAFVYVHEEDAFYLTDIQTNLSVSFGGGAMTAPYDHKVKDGEVLEIAKLHFDVIHTPGHTPGGVCYKMGGALFTGDTLFKDSMGRTDFPGGSYKDLMHSIQKKLKVLEEDVRIYPGHGMDSTIGREKQFNPAMREDLFDC